MNKIFNSLSAFIMVLINGIKRFYTNTCFTIIIFAISFYLINWDVSDNVSKTLGRIILVSILGFLISALFTLVAEKLNRNTNQLKIINFITSFTIPILYFFFILKDFDNIYQITSLAGILIALAVMSTYYANKTDNENFSIHFSYLVKTLFVAAIISLIVMLGLFLCIAAVYFLIYKFNEVDKIYATIAMLSWIVLFVNLFMAMLPKVKDEYKTPKFFKVITFYTALPIYIGLVAILYVYLGKIIVTQVFPSGQLNWFASFASIIGIFLFLALKQYYNDSLIVKWFVKLFGYILLPIIAMQCIAFNIRVVSYGYTTLRYVSAVLIALSIITAIVSLIKRGKYVPYVLFLFALCSIIITNGYLNFYDVPMYNQEARLVKILKDNSMLDDSNKIIAKADVDKEIKIKITSSYDYIAYEYNRVNIANKSKLLMENDPQINSFKQTFGFEKEYDQDNKYGNNYDNNKYLNYSSQSQEIDIDGYKNLINISNYSKKFNKGITKNTLTVNNNDKVYVFDLNKFINSLYNEYGVTETDVIPQDQLMIEQGNTKLIITHINFEVYVKQDEINILNIEGYILEK